MHLSCSRVCSSDTSTRLFAYLSWQMRYRSCRSGVCETQERIDSCLEQRLAETLQSFPADSLGRARLMSLSQSGCRRWSTIRDGQLFRRSTIPDTHQSHPSLDIDRLATAYIDSRFLPTHIQRVWSLRALGCPESRFDLMGVLNSPSILRDGNFNHRMTCGI